MKYILLQKMNRDQYDRLKSMGCTKIKLKNYSIVNKMYNVTIDCVHPGKITSICINPTFINELHIRREK